MPLKSVWAVKLQDFLDFLFRITVMVSIFLIHNDKRSLAGV